MTSTNFDDILSRVDSGPWTCLIFLLCSIWGVFGAMQAVASAFLSPVIDHWCLVPELDHWTREQLWNFSFPMTMVGGVPHHAQCEKYAHNYSLLVGVAWDDRWQALGQEETLTEEAEVVPCDAWEYDTSTFTSTIISEWQLVCGREWLRSLIQSLFMVGYFFGAPLGGYSSDRFGRKRVMGHGLVVFVVVGTAASLAPSYPLFLFCRLFMAFSGSIVYQTSYILAVEATPTRLRGAVGIMFSLPFALGFMLLPGVAYLLRDWRHLHLAISLPVALLIVNTFVLPESPRWLVQQGRWREAERVLERADRWNNTRTHDPTWLPAAISRMKAQAEDNQGREETQEGEEDAEEGEEIRVVRNDDQEAVHERENSSLTRSSKKTCSSHASCCSSAGGGGGGRCCAGSGGSAAGSDCGWTLELVRTPMMRRISLVMYFLWITCSLVYYGISLNSANFSADPFLYMLVGGLMEVPSYTLTVPVVARCGRRPCLSALFLMCGLAVLVLLFLPQERNSWVFLCLVMLAKFCITSAYQVIYLYSSELYPTELRTRGLGISSMMGRLGAIVSPFVNDLLGWYHWAIPTTIFGLLSVAAAALTCLLPETRSRPLPETVRDVEAWRHEGNDRRETVAVQEDGEHAPATTAV